MWCHNLVLMYTGRDKCCKIGIGVIFVTTAIVVLVRIFTSPIFRRCSQAPQQALQRSPSPSHDNYRSLPLRPPHVYRSFVRRQRQTKPDVCSSVQAVATKTTNNGVEGRQTGGRWKPFPVKTGSLLIDTSKVGSSEWIAGGGYLSGETAGS